MGWSLFCAYCDWWIYVGDRGQRAGDQGAGVEVADLMKRHVVEAHGHTWEEYLAAANPRQEQAAEARNRQAGGPTIR